MLTLCYSREDSDSIGGMAEAEAVEAYKLKEVYTRWLVEKMGERKAAAFSRLTGISKSELSTLKTGDRKATEGQILKVCARIGVHLSEALGRMAIIARDVEHEMQSGDGHVRLQEATEKTATIVTARGKKVTVRLDAAAATAKRLESEASTESKQGRKPQKRSRPESVRPRSGPEAPPHRPSPRS